MIEKRKSGGQLGKKTGRSARQPSNRAARIVRAVLLFLAGLALAGPPAVAHETRNILLLFSYGRLLPANLEGDRGLREGFAARPDLSVSVSVEYLDQLRFSGESYDRTLVEYLRNKYALQPPEVLMVAADEALDFVLRHRAELFPDVPIVHMSVLDEYLQSQPHLPPDVIGAPIRYDIPGTVAQSLRWHPKARRLVVVTGASEWDRAWVPRMRALAAELPAGITLEFIAGLPTAEVQQRLRALGPDAIVFTPGYHRDGNGREFAPRDAVRLIVAASPVPVYGPFSSFIGTGIVGGRMADYGAIGRVGAQMAIQLLEGAEPASIERAQVMPTLLQVDWRELQRWGIPDKAIPADAIVHYRKPSLWDAYRQFVIVGIAVIAIQTALIFALLFERRRRRRAMAALARSEELIRLAAQAASLSTWMLDERSLGHTGNLPAAAKPRNASGPLVDFGKTLERMSPLDRPVVEAALRDALDATGEFDIEYRVRDDDGEWAWQAARGRADHGDVPRLLGVAIDISQRKRAEAQAEQDRAALYHMTRVSILGQLSASIAHQLNQPLASIMGNAEAAQKMLEREPLDVAELRAICADIVAEDQRAAQVIRRLGVLFKRGESHFETLDVNELTRDTIEFTRTILTTRHVALSTQFATGPLVIEGDRVQLQQLVLNLMVNAADAMAEMPEGGRQLNISTSLQDASVKICVADKGPGVSPQDVDKVFEPFWSTRPGGMGMGLAVCRSIVEAHNGSLTVADAPGGGALFCALLPAKAAS